MSKPREKVGIALVGCGSIARFTHLRVLRQLPRARLVAVVDPDRAARETAARATGAEPISDLPSALERSDIDAVVISSPSACHAEQAVAACRAGKHVYVEKPVAVNIDDAHAVVAAARSAGVHVFVGYNRRLHPAVVQARAALAAGRIGGVLTVLSTFCEPAPAQGLPPWKRARATGGGVLLDLASHHADLIRWLLGREISGATAHLDSRTSEMDTAWVRWELSSGSHVQGFYSFDAGPIDVIEVIGKNGVVVIDRLRGFATVQARRANRYILQRPRPIALIAGLNARLRRMAQPAHDESYGLALAAFAAVVSGNSSGDAEKLATAEDGLRALEAIVLAERSCGF